MSLEDAMNPPRTDPLDRFFGSDDEDEDDGDGGITSTIIPCPMDEDNAVRADDFSEDSRTRMVSSKENLSRRLLPMGSIIEVTYDFGTTTMLYLKVLSVKEETVTSLLQYFTLEADHDTMKQDLSSIPAYALPKDQQVDHFFPNMSKAFMGYFIPLFDEDDDVSVGDDDAPALAAEKKAFGCASLGLLGPDTFCAMENLMLSQDLFYAPVIFDLNELFEVGEKAWMPRNKNSDPDKLDKYRYDAIRRWVVPAEDDQTYEEVKKIHKESGPWGAKHILFRLPKDRKPSGFDFAKVFPKTYAMLRSGKYRWFQYKKGTLRVIVGAGKGYDRRGFESNQILKAWKYDFQTLHELLCVVEASWMHNDIDLSPDAYLDEFDNVVELPNTPTLVSDKECKIISSCKELKKLVTVLALTEDPYKKPVLYSGHDDGTLTKWFLEEDTKVWSKRIYADGTEDFGRYPGCGLHVRETPGVAGIVVRPDPANINHHLVYTWSDAYEGYPRRDFEKRGPSTLRARSSIDGRLVKAYSCNIGADADGDPAYPSISTVVFCKLHQKDRDIWVDSIVVGLFSLCKCLPYDENFSDFDLVEAADRSEGNILPFWEHSNGRAMETWRGDPGLIRAMAVVEEKYLFTLSICSGHGFPHSIILWSLSEPGTLVVSTFSVHRWIIVDLTYLLFFLGVPLLRKDLQDGTRSFLRQFTTRLLEIVGVSINGNKILIANDHAREIAVLTINKDEDDGSCPSSIDINGYGKILPSPGLGGGFHGRMVSQKRYSIVANEDTQIVWIFNIDDCADHEKLDSRDGNPRNFENENCDEDGDDVYPGREIAIGKVKFPLWGGNEPAHKRRKQNDDSDEVGCILGLDDDESDDEWYLRDRDDSFGEGGPMAIAFRGRWIVAGFSNGTLVKALLPEKFADKESSFDISSNHLTSCSHLPSDEWHQPELECTKDDEDDEDDEYDEYDEDDEDDED